MKETVPSYYKKFKCIAGSCRHSCCIGWEIDIDQDTIELYNSLEGELGERIRNNIEGEPPHFILKEGERCPFLSSTGLCDIICEYGEDALCDICALHPRFNNVYSSFIETGLGLCCEEAARIILYEKEKFHIELPDEVTEEEKAFFEKREEIFSILQNRDKSIKERFNSLAEMFGLDINYTAEELKNLYLSLERLDESWTDILNNINGFKGEIFEKFSIEFEQLAVYFVFRHLHSAIKDKDFASRVGFAIISCMTIATVCGKDITDTARMYSAEVEYCQENMEKIIQSFK